MEDWRDEERNIYCKQLCRANQRIGALEYMVKRAIEIIEDKQPEFGFVSLAKKTLEESDEKK